jgi:hypothetical protein
MIIFSSNVRTLLSNLSGDCFYTVLIKDLAGTVYRASTTHFADVTLSDGNTYVSDDYLQAVDPPSLSATVDREQFKFVLADPEFLNGPQAELGLIGKKVEVRLCFFDKSTGAVLTNLADTFMMYKGRIDSSKFNINTEELGESLFALSGASPMASLEMARNGRITKEEIRAIDPTDSSADFVYEGSGAIGMKWGKL